MASPVSSHRHAGDLCQLTNHNVRKLMESDNVRQLWTLCRRFIYHVLIVQTTLHLHARSVSGLSARLQHPAVPCSVSLVPSPPF